MAVLIGIDEAGFGPILGPLVVSATALKVPSDMLNADLWRILRKSVGQTRKHLAGRILITDSKKAYTRSQGHKHLKRTVLACLKYLDKSPETLSELLTELCPESLQRLHAYPWYEQIDTYHLCENDTAVSIATDSLHRDMAANNIELLSLKSCCLDVAYYNKMVDAVKNKAKVLFTATSTLIKHAYETYDDDEIQIIVDRQGGRVHYRRNLQLMFDGMELHILQEKPSSSSYELIGSGKKMRIHFVVKADTRFMPVSLASMFSKYVRELLIDNINAYFRGFSEELKPTAGYWKDGLRFINDLKEMLPHVEYDSNQLIRNR
jgi:ribonuclease HII